MITSNHITTQPKWNIWLLNHEHSTAGTGERFNNRVGDDTEWEETSGLDQWDYVLDQIEAAVRRGEGCVRYKQQGFSLLHLVLRIHMMDGMWRENTRGNLQSPLQICLKNN